MGWPFLSIRREPWRGGPQWATLYVLNRLGRWDPVCYLFEVPASEDDLSLFYRGKTHLHEGTYRVRIFAGGPSTWGLELYQPGSRETLPIQQAQLPEPSHACLVLVDFRDFKSGGPKKRSPDLCARSRALMDLLRFRHSALSRGMREELEVTVATVWPAKNSVRALAG